MADVRVQVIDRDAAAHLEGLAALVERVALVDRDQPLSEHKRIELFGAGHHGFAAIEARDAAGALVGYAQLSEGHAGWGLEVVTSPERRDDQEALLRQLLVESLHTVTTRGGDAVRLHRADPTVSEDAAVRKLGGKVERELLQLRVSLPLSPAARAGTSAVAVRPFHPGSDEEAWIAVNNRAFADHPEQGGWDLEALTAREAEPWFDPAGFLLLEEQGKLVGSCWTKVHRDSDPPLGEIYVIGVDPAEHGRGLGRALTVAGLDWLAAAGLTTGMLYVDGSNVAAVTLYRSLGFTLHHAERAYLFEVP